jgi:hypothetical protein
VDLRQTLVLANEFKEGDLAVGGGDDPIVRNDARRSLEALVRDLTAMADRPAGEAAPEGLQDRLADAVRRLEASHPTLSTTLGNVVDTLAFFGL